MNRAAVGVRRRRCEQRRGKRDQPARLVVHVLQVGRVSDCGYRDSPPCVSRRFASTSFASPTDSTSFALGGPRSRHSGTALRRRGVPWRSVGSPREHGLLLAPSSPAKLRQVSERVDPGMLPYGRPTVLICLVATALGRRPVERLRISSPPRAERPACKGRASKGIWRLGRSQNARFRAFHRATTTITET